MTGHPTTTSVPLVSACLIVKDEEAVLARCLAALRGVADEIVVHDTGSSDGSVQIARDAGATVIEGTWEDDFAAARNTALAACRGEWILHVDADDVVRADVRALRRQLRRTPATVDAFLIEIENRVDDGTGRSYANRACRLFRRGRAHWAGRIHEQVTSIDPDVALRLSRSAVPLRLHHTGYLREQMCRQDKVARNLRIAEAAVADAAATGAGGDAASPELLLDLGRSLKAAGRLEEAATRCLEAADAGASTAVEAAALHFAVSCLLGMGDIDEARRHIERLRRVSTRQAIADFLAAQADLQDGRPESALALLDGIGELVDDHGKRLPSGVVPLHRGMARAMLGDWPAAADAFTEAVALHGAVRGNLGLVVDACDRAGRSVADVLRALRPDALEAVLAEIADAVPAMGLDQALEWTIRLRQAGVDDASPLLALATDDSRPPSLRVYAAATAVALGDDRGLAALREGAADVPETMFTRMLAELDGVASSTLPAFVEAAAGTPRRAFAMGRSLHSLGALEQAFALVAAALDALESTVDRDTAGTGVTEDDLALIGDIGAWLDATVANGAAAMASSSSTASALAAARTPLTAGEEAGRDSSSGAGERRVHAG